MNSRDFLTVVFKHKKKILTMFLLVAGLVTGVLSMFKPVYEAKSSVLVKPWREESARPGMAANGNVGLTLSQDELINTEIQILSGRELAERVIRTLKLETMYPELAKGGKKNPHPMDTALQTFAKNLKVTGVRKSNVITVTFQHGDPRIAAKAVNLLIETFKERHLELHSDPQSSFINTQLSSFEKKLKESEKELEAFQQANNAFSLQEQRSLLLKQRADLDTSYKIANNNVSELSKKIAATKAQLQYISRNNARYTQTERDKIVVDAKGKLLEMQLKEQELSRKYTANNALVVNARKEVELISRFLKEQEEGISGKVKTGNPVYQSMEIDLFRAEGELNSQLARVAAIKKQLRQLDQQISLLDLSENKILNMKREIAINEKNYNTYADRQEEARLAEAMNMLKLSNISVIQAAAVPARPLKSNNMVNNLILGVLFGIISGLGMAYLCEANAQTFSTPESVEKYLGLPVLLTVTSREVQRHVP